MKMSNQKQVDALIQNSDYLKLKSGEYVLRIVGDIHSVREHRIKVGDAFKNIACPTENKRDLIKAGETQDFEVPPCPVCELGYKTNKSFVTFCIDRADGQAYILKKGPRLMDTIIANRLDPNWGAGDDYDTKIKVTGQGTATKYAVSAVPKDKSEKLSEKELFNLDNLKDKVDLDKMTTPRTYEQIKEIIGEEFPVADETGDIPF